MMSWGISDYDNNGKYFISLNFPMEKTAVTEEFLLKLKELETRMIDEAEKCSELWFGEIVPRSAIEYSFNRIVKYNKIKDIGYIFLYLLYINSMNLKTIIFYPFLD